MAIRSGPPVRIAGGGIHTEPHGPRMPFRKHPAPAEPVPQVPGDYPRLAEPIPAGPRQAAGRCHSSAAWLVPPRALALAGYSIGCLLRGWSAGPPQPARGTSLSGVLDASLTPLSSGARFTPGTAVEHHFHF